MFPRPPCSWWSHQRNGRDLQTWFSCSKHQDQNETIESDPTEHIEAADSTDVRSVFERVTHVWCRGKSRRAGLENPTNVSTLLNALAGVGPVLKIRSAARPVLRVCGCSERERHVNRILRWEKNKLANKNKIADTFYTTAGAPLLSRRDRVRASTSKYILVRRRRTALSGSGLGFLLCSDDAARVTRRLG